jgi:tetratricopeptide (TPR) repeat protein
MSNQAWSQSAHKLRKSGDKEYTDKEFQSAEENYRKSLEAEKSLNGTYNLGNSVYSQARFAEAADYYSNSLSYADDDMTKSQIYYNLGNALLQEQKVEESIEAYKESLKLNPQDVQAKQNLFLAKTIKKQQEKEEREQEKNKNQDQKDQENKNQDQKDSEEQQQQQQEQNQQDSNKSEEQKQQEQQQNQEDKRHGEKQNLSKEDAAKLLKVIENEEKKVQEKMRKYSGKKKKIEKDW